jgi:PAS domain S-box-containing protein
VQPGQLASHYSDFAQRVHPDDHATVSAALNRHLKGGAPYDLEFRMRREDGEHIWVHVYGQAQFDDGVAVRMAGSLQDITHERQQQQALRRWEAKLRLLIENTPAAVAMFDKEMRYILTSRRWLQDYGLEGRDIIGMSHYDVFPEIRSMPRWVEIHQRALRGEKFDMHEDCWVRANGRQEWHQWALHPWFEGDEVQGLVLFTENITGRKQADAALRTSEAMVRAAMDKAPIGKALVQPNGAFLKVNPALCRMLGYSEEELLAADVQAITHPEDLAEDLANVRALLDGKVVSYQMEKRYLHRDGRVIWAELSVSLVRRANGEPDFFVSQIQDISERKAIDRIKDEFVSVISHEVCAPLTVIRESLNMIAAMRGVELPTPVRRLFEASRGSCDRLATLVNDIHDLDRIAAGRLPLEFRDESIAYIARQAVEAGEFHARKHDVNITLAPIDPAIIVYVDPGRLLQALTNLLSNAAKFSPPGSEVQVGAELHGDSVRLLVRDRGEGIPEEFRARIFGRFAQAGSRVAHQRAGTGLGLHLARELVEQMRGNIGFVTQVGAGSTFWVEFPIVSRAVPAAALC